MTALTHILFAEERSLEFIKNNQLNEALGSFLAVVKRYPETKEIAQIGCLLAALKVFKNLNGEKLIKAYMKEVINGVGNPWSYHSRVPLDSSSSRRVSLHLG